MKLCIHFFTPVARLAANSTLFRVFDLRKKWWVGLLILGSMLFLAGTQIGAILGVFSVFTDMLIGPVLFLILLFLTFAGVAAPIAEEVLQKAARRPPQTTEFENDLAPRLVSYFSVSTSPDLRPPKKHLLPGSPPPEVEVTMVTK